MKKKFILLAMMLLTIIGGAKFNVLNAQETITIGSGDGTSKYLPSWIYYKYSVSQQFFSATEIGHADGLITQIAIRPKGSANTTRKFEIYIENTEDSMFPNGKTESYLVSTLVFSGDVSFGASGSWTVIELDTPFEYSGKNVLLCINDITGSDLSDGMDFYTYSTGNNTSAYRYNDNSKYEPSTTTYSLLSAYSNYFLKFNNQIQFTFGAPAEPSLEVSETSIALGNVRMDDNFFTEKPFSPKDVEVKVTSTTVTNVTCDNNFFTIELPAEVDYSKTFTFKVGYNKEANVTEPQNGTITIKWQDGEDVTIPVSATPYTATAPDAIEVFETVSFDENNAFISTPTFGNLHDDYILPGEEETDGNAPDAVYKFELKDDATISASITGNDITNSYLAIYNAETIGDGPSSNNNDQGVQSGPQGPTTFGPYTFTTDGTDLTNNFNSRGWVHYAYGYDYIYTSTAGSYILTKIPFQITNNSVLSFAAKNVYASGTEYYNVFISTDDVYGNADDIIVKTGSTTSTTNESIPLENYSGNEYYIGISYTTKYNMVGVDNLALTGGDGGGNQSQAISEIDGAQYPAGTYYLVAAADNAFTVNLSTASVPAPAEFALTTPEDNAKEQNNPELTWETAQYALSYNVYLGTSEDLTNVEPKTVTTNSYQTEGLQNNTRYYWTVEAVNAQGTTATTSGTWSFVTTLDVPQNVTVTSENHIAGGDITLKWDAIEGAKYNVYVGDICHNGETPITATEYTISNVDYSKEGWNITVTAVYEGLGESEKSETVNVKVTGYGHILVNVNGGISNVNYTINGTDEFGNVVEEITGTTDNVGMATVKVLAGTYTVTVSKFDYKDATMETVVVNYDAQTEATLTMTQKPAASFAVTAVDNVTTANVSWTTDEYTTFNVYRRNVKTDEVEKIASNVYYKQYQDAAWNEFAAGDEYEYGVSAMMNVSENPVNDNFNTSIGDWTTTNNNSNAEVWKWMTDGYGGGYINMYKYEGSSFGNKYSVYKSLDLIDIESAVLNFKYRTYSEYGSSYKNTLSVSVVTDLANIYSATPIWSSNEYTGQVWNESGNVNLNEYIGGSVYVVFTTNMNYCNSYLDDIVVTTTFKSESRVNWAPAITKEEWVAFDGTEDNTWSEKNVLVAADHTINGEVTVNKLSINGGTLTVAKNAKLTVNGKLNNATSAKFVIEDGAQVFQSSADVKATFNMGIINPSEWSNENKEGWNFVSSPFTAAGLSQFTFDLSGNGLDLYRYNGAKVGAEWRHYNVGNAEFVSNNFDLGYGYMLAHETKETVSLYGTLNNASEHTWEVSYTENAVNGDLANFHLVGNPFSFDMDMNKLAQTNMVTGYAVLNAEGNAYTYATEGTVKVGDAFFVKTTAAEPTMSYNHFVRSTRGEKASSLNIIATSAEGSDNVIVNLAGAEKEGFNKLQNFNEAIATVYVQHEDKNYGIINCNEDVQEIELCFNANQMGNYTISIEPNGKFQSVTLVDRFTGIETNMLLEDYNFTAMSNVNNNRFIVKLVNGQQTTDNSHFAYVMGEELIVEVEGSVQIIDMMGRVVYSNEVESANNRIDVSAFDNAAYVIRVINENGVKTQKIIL